VPARRRGGRGGAGWPRRTAQTLPPWRPVLRENLVPCDFTGFSSPMAHQGLNGIPDPDPALTEPKPLVGRLVAIHVLNGLHHDYRLAA